MIRYLETNNAYSNCGDMSDLNQQQKKWHSLVQNELWGATFLSKEGLDAFFSSINIAYKTFTGQQDILMYLSFCIFTFLKANAGLIQKKKSAQDEKFHYWFYPFVCVVIFFF